MTEFLAAPADSTSAARLADEGLRYDTVDTNDRQAFESWILADIRGFHGANPTPENLAASLNGYAYRRTTGVWDDAVEPVATVSSWSGPLTVPGGRELEAWSISSVTVAPTHRRRGIARALLEGELRTAASLNVPLAILTVSESTIYGRFGFAPGAFAAKLSIDTRRARWTGRSAAGRVRFIPVELFRTKVEQMHEQLRLRSPGQVPGWPLRWDQISELTTDDPGRARAMRAIAYEDADGIVTGVALYRLVENERDFTQHTLAISHLVTATDDAYAGVWRFLLEMDLVSTVTLDHASIDEPLLWQVSDRRAVKLDTWDHLWLRILDVATTLQARTYDIDGDWVFEVIDDLGFASGTYALTVRDGVGAVSVTDAPAPVTLTVNALSALYLGGVTATTLAPAGLITERAEGAADELHTAFHGSRVPSLSIWF